MMIMVSESAANAVAFGNWSCIQFVIVDFSCLYLYHLPFSNQLFPSEAKFSNYGFHPFVQFHSNSSFFGDRSQLANHRSRTQTFQFPWFNFRAIPHFNLPSHDHRSPNFQNHNKYYYCRNCHFPSHCLLKSSIASTSQPQGNYCWISLRNQIVLSNF